MEEIMTAVSTIAKWGNSRALRIPAGVLRQLDLNDNDKVFLEVSKGKLIITKTPSPKKGSLEYLFRDYSGKSFKTKLVNPKEAAGNEQW
jgi:antitoxin MazE